VVKHRHVRMCDLFEKLGISALVRMEAQCSTRWRRRLVDSFHAVMDSSRSLALFSVCLFKIGLGRVLWNLEKIVKLTLTNHNVVCLVQSRGKCRVGWGRRERGGLCTCCTGESREILWQRLSLC
jgi:hypothetical protein